MSIDVRPVCPVGAGECIVEIEQTVDMVLDIDRSKRPRDNPIPRPVKIEDIPCDTSKPYDSQDSCYPLDHATEPAWSISEIFGRPLKGACPLTAAEGDDAETVCLNVPPSGRPKSARRDITRGLRPRPPRPVPRDFNAAATIPLYATRAIVGHGQERGGIQAVLTNPSSSAVDLVYLESLPWFMKPYLHTLKATITPPTTNNASHAHPIKETYYRPALDRRRGTHLELLLTIPPASTLTLSYDFDKAILRYTEYPPDANRGFDVAPAVVRLLASSSSSGDDSRKGVYVRTTSLLLPLPTPDFSMPYNVIILTSTVMALGFGSIFNILVRRFVGADEVERRGLAGLKGILRGRIARWRARLGGRGIRRYRHRVLELSRITVFGGSDLVLWALMCTDDADGDDAMVCRVCAAALLVSDGVTSIRDVNEGSKGILIMK
ncbi:Subunit of the glycosylphosphatidylinositol transamidase complex-like protein [Coniosporium tulheliwenetii]|uniref:Subunit of the glycosylphosphatidylinositol transamidase complex-like protein n=1 Tax=Coniosporium tulheliwenetii TaxID=3383036 RepID=A0ACC2YZE0_9PEZI|nr:Subunit of the glycosylphosphatidylinositol transamidase complex-like protein [Cladosporium sp. JES 115]